MQDDFRAALKENVPAPGAESAFLKEGRVHALTEKDKREFMEMLEGLPELPKPGADARRHSGANPEAAEDGDIVRLDAAGGDRRIAAMLDECEEIFRRLEWGHERGLIGDDEYSRGIRELAISLPDGRVIAIQEKTGQWHVLEGGRWFKAAPRNAGSGRVKVLSRNAPDLSLLSVFLLLWWIPPVMMVFMFDGIYFYLSVLAALTTAVVSLAYTVRRNMAAWEGEIEYFDGDTAYVAIAGGKRIKTARRPGWREGDILIKRRWQTFPKKL